MKARDHINSGKEPTLHIALRPENIREWSIRQQVIAEIRNKADIFGLIKAGDIESP
jgi:hypothetical protein